MHGEIIKGNHVFKANTESMKPFLSVNAPLIGTINENGSIKLNISQSHGGEPQFIDIIDTNFIVLPVVPDLKTDIFDFLASYDNVILRAYGAGGIPVYLESAVKKLIESGTKVYITTQCTEGSVDLHKYEVGRRAEKIGAVSLGCRSIEDSIAAIQCGEL